MFIHPGHIPISFANAVYRVMHNQASHYDWNLIDKNKTNALAWVEEILVANGVEDLEKELNWWQEMIKG